MVEHYSKTWSDRSRWMCGVCGLFLLYDISLSLTLGVDWRNHQIIRHTLVHRSFVCPLIVRCRRCCWLLLLLRCSKTEKYWCTVRSQVYRRRCYQWRWRRRDHWTEFVWLSVLFISFFFKMLFSFPFFRWRSCRAFLLSLLSRKYTQTHTNNTLVATNSSRHTDRSNEKFKLYWTVHRLCLPILLSLQEDNNTRKCYFTIIFRLWACDGSVSFTLFIHKWFIVFDANKNQLSN